MSDLTPTIGLIGAGNMASAMISGWVKADPAMAGRILVTDRGSGRAAALAASHGVRYVAGNAQVVDRVTSSCSRSSRSTSRRC